MTKILVICDGAQPLITSQNEDNILRLNTVGPNPNVRFQISEFPNLLLRDIPARLQDLLRLSAIIYAADTRVRRGTIKDVFGEKWSRFFHIALPVLDYDFWNRPEVLLSLTETLNYLTGDDFTFEFQPRTKNEELQNTLKFKELIGELSEVDVIVLFSGGIDSLAATIDCILDNHHPLLVSHRSAPPIDSRQKNLVKELKNSFPNWQFPHLSMWVNRSDGKRTVEYTQRSRSFLFTSMGVTAASILNLHEVRLCDNGVVSINLPQSGQNFGTLLSRSTHPRYIELVNTFMKILAEDSSMSIRNNLLLKTKKEAMEIIANSGHPELIQETVSCSHTEGITKLHPHCGVCSQCIDRRFNSIAADLTQYDLVERYKKDVFTNSLNNGEERTHAENYVRFALELEKLPNADKFFEKYPQIFDCLTSDINKVDEFGLEIWDLFQRHQLNINKVVEKMIQDSSELIRKGNLDKNSLIDLISSSKHKDNPYVRRIKALSSVICDNIPSSFHSNPAKDEKHVQEIVETILNAAEEELCRESPQIPYSVVATKPDFSDSITTNLPIFIEVKFPKNRARLNGIITEITSRITIYRDQGACVLFIVYDPNRVIPDDSKFSKDFEKHQMIFVGISR